MTVSADTCDQGGRNPILRKYPCSNNTVGLGKRWLPFLAGLVWLWYAYRFGVIGFLFAIIPGCMLLSAMSFLSAGFIALTQEPHTDDVPEPRRSLGLAAEIATDDTVLAMLVLGAPMFVDKDHNRISREVHGARELFQKRGWLNRPGDFHLSPPPISPA